MRVGMLTGGGDCPGLNAVIRAATRRLVDGGAEPIGVLRGWRGMIDGLFRPLDQEAISGILPRGGTILRTSRTNPFSEEGGLEAVRTSFEQLDGLIAIGGEDTLGVAARLHVEHGLPVIGVPKTIDNDLAATDQTFGFDTAVSIATEAIDRLHTTAESHDRVMVVEVMGRHAGWLAVASGLAGGADVVLIPEFPLTVERCAELIRQRHARGKDFSIVVVSEGWPLTREEGAEELSTPTGRARRVRARAPRRRRPAGSPTRSSSITGFETRVTTLGHLQRGGTPTAYDRVLATRYGLLAARPRARAALRPDDGAARHGRRRRRRWTRPSRSCAPFRARTTRWPRRSSADPSPLAGLELALDPVDELAVQVEQAAQEPGDEQQVLAPVGERLRARLELVDARRQVGDLVAQRDDARARRRLADEVGDQQAQQQLALDRREVDGRGRPLAQRRRGPCR